MKEGLQKPDNDKINRRKFLKTLGLGVAAAGIVAAGEYKFNKFLNNEFAEQKKHEKQGEAVISEKHHNEVYNQVLPVGKIPTIIPHPEEWIITLKIKEQETPFSISKEEYDKYKVGDKVPVRYDDRNMKVEKILTAN